MIPLNLKSIIPCSLLQYYFEITVLALTAKKFKTHPWARYLCSEKDAQESSLHHLFYYTNDY